MFKINDRVQFVGMYGDSGQSWPLNNGLRVVFGALGTVVDVDASYAHVVWDDLGTERCPCSAREIVLVLPVFPKAPSAYHDQGAGPYDPRIGAAYRPEPVNVPEPEPVNPVVLAITYTGPISTARSRGPERNTIASLEPRWVYQTRPERDSYGGRIEVPIRVHRECLDVVYGQNLITTTIFQNTGRMRSVTVQRVGYSNKYQAISENNQNREYRLERMQDRAYQAMHLDSHSVYVVNDNAHLDWESAFLSVSMSGRVVCIPSQGPAWFGRQRWNYSRPHARLEVFRFESWEGYDSEGWTEDGFDREGFDHSGFNRSGWDREGFNRSGWSRYGNHRDGRHRDDCRCPECDIQGYHGTPRDWKLPDDWKDRILFGLENELDTEDRDAQIQAVKLLPKRGKADWFLIAERDGSLGEYGIEFVGPPLPIEYYLGNREEAKINPWFDYLPKIVDSCGADAPEHDHGMHINVSRQPLVMWDKMRGQRWEKRFLDTINSCKRLVQFVAGRKANEWADFQAKGPSRYAVTGEGNGIKYRVANVQKNVIELRIFRASTNPVRMRANVQFCYAVLMWTKRGYRARGSRCDARLISWIKDHPTKYPDLIGLLNTYEPAGPRDDMPEPPSDYRADWIEASACGPEAHCGACERQRAIRLQYPHLTTAPIVATTLPTNPTLGA